MKQLDYCVLAGGCFWCMAKPYYEYEGIKKVFSGYSGGKEKNPIYVCADDFYIEQVVTNYFTNAIKNVYTNLNDDGIISFRDSIAVDFINFAFFITRVHNELFFCIAAALDCRIRYNCFI